MGKMGEINKWPQGMVEIHILVRKIGEINKWPQLKHGGDKYFIHKGS